MGRLVRDVKRPAGGAFRPAQGRGRGFTMLEILVVLTLIGLIAAVTIPTFSGGVSTTALKSAAREIAAGLRLARGQAIAQRTEATLELDVAARAFRVLPDPRVHVLPREIEIKLYTAQRDLVSDQVGAVRFYPDGGSNGGRITLAVGERKFDVDVDWLTGRVSVLE
jgi:general secretion pathway protein H